MSATGVPPVEVTAATVTPKDGVCTFSLKINDPRLHKARTQAFIDGEPSKLIGIRNGIATFEYSAGDKENIVITPRFNSTDFLPLQIQVVVPGRYRLATTSIFGSIENGKYKFRLLVLGNHNIDTALRSASLQIDKADHEAKIVCVQRGKLLHVDFELAKALEGRALAVLGNTELNFSLRVKP